MESFTSIERWGQYGTRLSHLFVLPFWSNQKEWQHAKDFSLYISPLRFKSSCLIVWCFIGSSQCLIDNVFATINHHSYSGNHWEGQRISSHKTFHSEIGLHLGFNVLLKFYFSQSQILISTTHFVGFTSITQSSITHFLKIRILQNKMKPKHRLGTATLLIANIYIQRLVCLVFLVELLIKSFLFFG